MPDETLGCLVVIFRALTTLGGAILDIAPLEFIGFIGKWTLCGITLGRFRCACDDLAAVMTGLAVVVASVVLGVWLL
jgi:hypothetical protein